MTELLEYDCFKHETLKATLVKFTNMAEPIWVPNSVIVAHAGETGGDIEIDQWFVEKECLE